MIYLVRHGLDDENYIGGHSSVDLIDEGIIQVNNSALFIKDKAVLTFLTVDHQMLTYFYFLIFPIILFRIYDIKKPWIIGKIDLKMKNALGVMLDDVVGGIFAGLTNSAIMFIILKMFAI